MLFRPEEVHGASGLGEPIQPLCERHRYIGHDTLGFGFYYRAILDFHVQRCAAIQAGGADLNYFPWKEPANCQRLKTSLAKPFLLTLYGDAVLGGQVAERCKTTDIVGIRE
jgi:hypothetical protein